MASEIKVWVAGPNSNAGAKAREAEQVFRRVEAACTRFDPESPLMRANRAGRRWHAVPRECTDAVAAAAEAYRTTGGLFDPRVLTVLQSYGYGSSLSFQDGPVSVSSVTIRRRPRIRFSGRSWRPGIDDARSAVRIGPVPIDLGGIGKGLAVRWAIDVLRDAGRAVLVEAGGDCYACGGGLDGDGWAISVENPFGGTDPVAVLALTDLAVATSSTRLRSWTVDGRPVHHLIDPRTQEAAESRLASVTVVHADPALAEVWSKALFVAGRTRVRAVADRHGLAAMWVDLDGRVVRNRRMSRYVAWEAPRVP